MIDDFKPVKRPDKSLRTALEQRSQPETKTNTETFQTPEEVAAEQDLAAAAAATGVSEAAPTPARASAHRKLALRWPPGKKEWISVAVVILLVIGGSSGWFFTHHKAKVVAVKSKPLIVKKQAPPVPTTVPSALTGLQVDPKVNSLPVTGVMIENSQDARPQSGLSQAGIVFEAIAEGGITRFLALFQDTSPDNVGPIRSARPYYEQWALGFDAGYAHVGGSPEALADIKSWGVRDLDQFANGGSYHRVSSRPAPHNVYTGIGTLNQLETKKGYNSSTFNSLPRKAETPVKVPTAKTVNLVLSGPLYNVQYLYDPTTNSYKRSEAGAPHMDANTNTQISPKVVVALVMPYKIEPDGYHSDYTTIGTGPIYVFQDGMVTTGQWAKSSNSSQFIFTDSSGAVIKLNPGQTWLTAIAKTSNVTYSP
jgi:hypothetical protein